VKSCPASRAASIDELDIAHAELALKEVFNTASSFGDIDEPLVKDISKCFDEAGFMPFLRTRSFEGLVSTPKETVFNTAELEIFRQRIVEVAREAEEAPQDLSTLNFNTASTFAPEAEPRHTCFVPDVPEEPALHGRRLTAGERLRMTGSLIRQTIDQSPAHDQTIAFDPVSPNPWFPVTEMQNNMLAGLEQMLMCGVMPEQQQPFLPGPSEAQAFEMSMAAAGMSVMPPYMQTPHDALPPPPRSMAPVAALEIRLSEAIAPPELGGPQLPSIGSMLHHQGGCRPCTFFHTRGCENKVDCKFCHLCGPGEKKKRLKVLKHVQREATFIALENAKAKLASWSAAEASLGVDMIIE